MKGPYQGFVQQIVYNDYFFVRDQNLNHDRVTSNNLEART